MKKILILLISVVIAAGCTNNASVEKKENKTDSTDVRIAVQPTLECLPLMVAEEKGLFDSCGVKVNLITYTSQDDCDSAVLNNSADAMITDIVRAVHWEKENKKSLNYATWTTTHHMLVSSKKARIKDLSQMEDRLMAVTRNSVTDILADSAMQRAEKSPEQMFKVQINDQNIRLGMLLSNKMDAAFLQHPYAAEAVKAGGNILMHGGKEHAGLIAFSSKADAQSVEKILKAYDEACTMINEKGIMHFSDVAEKYIGKDIRKLEKQIGKIKFRHSEKIDASAKKSALSLLDEN